MFNFGKKKENVVRQHWSLKIRTDGRVPEDGDPYVLLDIYDEDRGCWDAFILTPDAAEALAAGLLKSAKDVKESLNKSPD